MTIKRAKVIELLIFFMIFIFSIILNSFYNNYFIFFFLNILICTIIVLKCKMSFISIKMVVVNYIQFSVVYQLITGTSYGILEYSNKLIHPELFFISIFLYNLTWYILVNFTNILSLEKRKNLNRYSISKKGRMILIIACISCTLIAFPTLPFNFNVLGRFKALLPGNAWNHFVVAILIVLIGDLKKDKLVQLTFLFSIFWFLSHYERVDVLGIIIFIVYYFFINKKIKLNITKIAKYGTIILIIFSFLTFIGSKRSGVNFSQNLFHNVLVQSTAADVAYVYNISIDYSIKEPKFYGMTYLEYVVEAIPLLNYDKSVTSILKSRYHFPGGEYILSSSIMNFGVVFIPIFAIIEFTIYSILLKSKGNLSLLLFLFLIATQFRVNWYGIHYVETGFIYIIPIIYFIFNKAISSLKFTGVGEVK